MSCDKWKGTSRERLYNELGLHSLNARRWRSKLIFIYKIVNDLLPEYLQLYLNFPSQDSSSLRSASAFQYNLFHQEQNILKKHFSHIV